MQKATRVLISIIALYHHANNPAAIPSIHHTLTQNIQSPMNAVCICDTCAFNRSADLFKSDDPSARAAGKSFLKSIIKEEQPFAPFARIALATSATTSKKCHDLLMPVIMKNTSNLPDQEFAIHQLIASNLMMQPYQREQKTLSACIAACNTYAIAHNNELDPTHPTIKAFVSPSVQQMYDSITSNPGKSLGKIFPDLDTESAEILSKLETAESTCLRGKLALEANDTHAACQLFQAAYILSEEKTIVFLNSCKTPLASAILGKMYFKKLKKRGKECAAEPELTELLNHTKKNLSSSAMEGNPLGELLCANFLHESTPSISQADQLEKIYLSLIGKNQLVAQAFTGLAEIYKFRFQKAQGQKKNVYAAKAIQFYTQAMNKNEESKNNKEYIKSSIKLMNFLHLQQKTAPKPSKSKQPIVKHNVLKIARSLHERYPTDATVLTECAKFHLKCTQNISLAKKLAFESLKTNPTKKSTLSLINKIFTILSQKETLDNISNFAREVLSIAPNNREANLHFARKYLRQNNMDESIKHFKASINSDNSYEFYKTGITILMLQMDTMLSTELPLFSTMKSCFKKAVQMEPTNPSYLHSLSKIYVIEKKDKKVLSTLKTAANKNHPESISELAYIINNGYGGHFSPMQASELFKRYTTLCENPSTQALNIILSNLACYQDPRIIKTLLKNEDEITQTIADFEKMGARIENRQSLNEIFYTVGLLYLASAKHSADPIKKRNNLFKAKISFNKIEDESGTNPRYFYYKAKTETLLAHAMNIKVKESAENAIKVYEKIIDQQQNLSPNHVFIKKSYKKLSKIYTDILEELEIGLSYLKKAHELENHNQINHDQTIAMPTEDPNPICSSSC